MGRLHQMKNTHHGAGSNCVSQVQCQVPGSLLPRANWQVWHGSTTSGRCYHLFCPWRPPQNPPQPVDSDRRQEFVHGVHGGEGLKAALLLLRPAEAALLLLHGHQGMGLWERRKHKKMSDCNEGLQVIC